MGKKETGKESTETMVSSTGYSVGCGEWDFSWPAGSVIKLLLHCVHDDTGFQAYFCLLVFWYYWTVA